jgi:hypothetical protein
MAADDKDAQSARWSTPQMRQSTPTMHMHMPRNSLMLERSAMWPMKNMPPAYAALKTMTAVSHWSFVIELLRSCSSGFATMP